MLLQQGAKAQNGDLIRGAIVARRDIGASSFTEIAHIGSPFDKEYIMISKQMTKENFNPTVCLPEGYYPWPNMMNQHAAALGPEVDSWFDNAYAYLTLNQREKYKKMALHLCAGRMVPTINRQKLIACTRFVVQFVVWDDQQEFSNREEVGAVTDRMIEILKGADPAPHESGMFWEMAVLRNEYAAFMPPEWMDQFVRNLSRACKYGIREEVPFRLAKRTPNLAHFLIIREYSVNMYPYFIWAAIEADFVLPKYIEEHPVMQRLMALACRLEGWQNDFHSYAKEQGLDSEVMNLISVVQKTYNLSLEEACVEAKRIHDSDVAEFVALHENLPDFGVHQQKMYDYVTAMGAMLQGLNSHYINDTLRYLPGGEGFAWPEDEVANQYRTNDFKLG